MRLNQLNKGLKKEYRDTFEEPKRRKTGFKIRWVVLACVAALFVFLIGEHIGVQIYNENLVKEQEIIREEFLNAQDANLIKVNSRQELKNLVDKNTMIYRSNKKSILSSLFSIRLVGCASSGGVYDGSGSGEFGPSSFDTNIQTAGMDEADSSKCDGTYIYSILEANLYVYDLRGNLVDSIHCPATELYIYNNYVITLGQFETTIYDFSNKKLKEVKSFEYSKLCESRLKDNMLYVVYGTFLSNEPNVDYENLYYDGSLNTQYAYSIMKIDLNTMKEESVSILNSFSMILYASLDHFYLTSTNYIGEKTITQIVIIDMDLNPKGCLRFVGSVLNQYSMDEYNGYLRVVSTDRTAEDCKLNHLSIYNLETMTLTGKITENIGLDRQIVKSVRFDNNTCYVVTYLNTDPLYEIDCSDPTNPVIISTYKAPGYSSYLHSFAINEQKYVLGIGYTDSFDPKISVYKDTEATEQIGKDLVIYESYYGDSLLDENNYTVDYIVTAYLRNPKALFLYNDQRYFYIGMMVGRNEYTIFKIDVENEANVISVYKEYEVHTDYEKTRGFLVNGTFYIPEFDNIKMDSWA